MKALQSKLAIAALMTVCPPGRFDLLGRNVQWSYGEHV